MTAALIIVGYAIVWLFAARTALTAFENDVPSDGNIDRAFAATMACFIALLWPLAGPVFLVMKTRRKSPRELEREIAERDRRIADLERELGIGRNA